MHKLTTGQRLLQGGLVGALLFLPGWAPPARPAALPAAVVYPGAHLTACGVNSDGTQTSTATTFAPLLECSFKLSGAGHLIVLGNATVGLVNAADSYQATLRLSENEGNNGNAIIERIVDVYPDHPALMSGGDGTDRSVALTGYYTVTAGTHDLKLVAKRSAGTATMKFVNATLSAVFIPDDTDLETCGGNFAVGFLPADNYLEAAACSFTAPRPGLVFVSADGRLTKAGSSSPYEAAYRLMLDSGAAYSGIRYTDVYSYTADDENTTATVTAVFSVTAGVHTVTLSIKQQSGLGQVQLYYPGLAVLFVPFDSPYAEACGALGASTWSNNTVNYTALASCTLAAPSDSWVFLSGNAGLNQPAANRAPYEARLGVGRDSLTALAPTSRYVNSYLDDRDGTDAPMTTSAVLPNPAGAHTFYLVGRRYTPSTGTTVTVAARTGTLFALVPAADVFVPAALK